MPIALATALTIAGLLAAPPKRGFEQIRHVVLDPGHGGENKGTAGAHGVHEKLLTLPIALEVERLLRRHKGVQVTLTRRDDRYLGLRERARVANAAGADVFLSIHLNAGLTPDAQGVEVYFLSPDTASEEIARLVAREDASEGAGAPKAEATPLTLDQVLKDAQLHEAHAASERLAEVLLESLHEVLGAPRRGVFQAPFGVLKEAMMPAVVVEVGFLSHAVEGRKLTTAAYRDKVALAIYRALVAIDGRL